MKKLKAFLILVLIVPTVLLAQTSGAKTVKAPTANPGQFSTEVKTYDQLRHAISQARAQSRVRVEKAVEQERVREAWEIGSLIDAHVLQHKERADYGKQVLERLASDLGMSRTELSYMLQLFRAYPIFQRSENLSWAHYQTLLSVNDPKERKALEEKASKENWTRDRLREEIKALKRKSSSSDSGESASTEKISPVPHSGNPGVYRIILAKAGPYAGELALDLGFSNYVRLADEVGDTTPFKEGDVVAFLKESGEVLKSRPEELYTYRAWVLRVLDGDTVDAVIDLGFGFTTTQILRLRAIDAPEILTRDGKAAKEFVEKMLNMPERGEPRKGSAGDASWEMQAKADAPVFIKTSKSDKYDRYLADVFITDKSGEEQYLNNLLLEQGHAVRVRE